MKIAVTYDNGNIFQHFGHTEKFKVYNVENGQIVSEEIIDTNGQGHGALAGFLQNAKADMLICGGIGGGAQMAMAEAGIKLFAGNSGSADDAVKKYLAGELVQITSATCDHHDHEHHDHGEGHSCGGHCHN
ncbi:MAG: NifB/NifX family molybdenum-iron cluster-binding protein [Firmicutes bacterium]|nr:NifB/NifX family molybdenum-iron cluster-binding protein [Bacillota bacterium]